MNKRFVSKETVVPNCQCERETLKFGTKQVDIKVISTLKKLNQDDVLSITPLSFA